MNDAPASPQKIEGRPGSFLALLTSVLVLAGLAILLGMRVRSLGDQLQDNQSRAALLATDKAQLQQSLDKLREESVQAQGRLEKATATLAVLQSRLDKAKGEKADLQSQIEAARTEGGSRADALQTQVELARSQIADLKGRLGGAESACAQAAAQLAQSRAEVSDLRSRLAKSDDLVARLQPIAAKARRMPVATSLDASPVSGALPSRHAYALRINNLQTQPLKVEITVDGQGGRRQQAGVIGATSAYTLDRLAAGETVVVSSEGFDPVSIAVQ